MKILLLILLPITLFATQTEVSWEAEYTSSLAKKSTNALRDIQKDIVAQVNAYLKPRKQINVDAIIPPEIKKPLLPPKVAKPVVVKYIKLKQGKYEPKSAFKARVEKENQRRISIARKQKQHYEDLINKRNEVIERYSKNYKEAVKKRNAQVLEIQDLIDQDLNSIKEEQLNKEEKLDKVLPIFVEASLKSYLGDPIIISSDYFVNSEKMQIVLASKYNNFREKLEFSVAAHDAQQIDKDLTQLKPKVSFILNSNSKNNHLSFRMGKVELSFNGKTYLATPANKRSKNFVTANLEIDDPTNVSIMDQKLDLQADDLKLALQQSKLKAISYRITTVKNNEILNRLKGLKAAKKSDKKWLFTIGIEKYANGVAPIAYSKQSALSFSKLAQKLLGVPKENVFTLIDHQATSGAIKSKIKFMLRHIKKGDTVYFYYSGHGIPVALEGNEPYILPQDIDPNYINDEKFFKLSNLYKRLSNSKAKKVIAIIDSCFSGATDGKFLLKGVAAARLVPKSINNFNKKKMVVLSAGKEKQYSNMYAKKEQRLFSYFVMDALLQNNKHVNTLYKDVAYQVEKASRKMGNLKIQQPTLSGNDKLMF